MNKVTNYLRKNRLAVGASIICLVLILLFPIAVVSNLGFLIGSYSESFFIWFPLLAFYIWFSESSNKAMKTLSYLGFLLFAYIIIEYIFAITSGISYLESGAKDGKDADYKGLIASLIGLLLISSIVFFKGKKLKILASIISLAIIRLIVMEVAMHI